MYAIVVFSNKRIHAPLDFPSIVAMVTFFLHLLSAADELTIPSLLMIVENILSRIIGKFHVGNIVEESILSNAPRLREACFNWMLTNLERFLVFDQAQMKEDSIVLFEQYVQNLMLPRSEFLTCIGYFDYKYDLEVPQRESNRRFPKEVMDVSPTKPKNCDKSSITRISLSQMLPRSKAVNIPPSAEQPLTKHPINRHVNGPQSLINSSAHISPLNVIPFPIQTKSKLSQKQRKKQERAASAQAVNSPPKTWNVPVKSTEATFSPSIPARRTSFVSLRKSSVTSDFPSLSTSLHSTPSVIGSSFAKIQQQQEDERRQLEKARNQRRSLKDIQTEQLVIQGWREYYAAMGIPDWQPPSDFELE